MTSRRLAKCDARNPGSLSCKMTRKVHKERVLLLGWGRAILLQLAHPLVAAGVAEHSSFRLSTRERLRRLHRTLHAMLQLTFGGPDAVAQVARGINAIHDRVHGHLCKEAGSFKAGTPYSAHDPTLLRWVHATLIDSHLLVYQRFVGPLTLAEQDQYCRESANAERLFGIPDGYLPRYTEDLRLYMDRMLSSGEIVVTDTSRALAREVISPSACGVTRPLVWLMRLTTLGLLPSTIRDAYGFPWDARHERVFHVSTRIIRGLIPRLPEPLRYWRDARLTFRPPENPAWLMRNNEGEGITDRRPVSPRRREAASDLWTDHARQGRSADPR